ncbi:MAG: Hsp20/alpha crystallin family protein [Flavobacteriales bacterium]
MHGWWRSAPWHNTKYNIKYSAEQGKVTRREFCYSSLQRSFTLSKNVDKQKIDAKYVDGILSFDLTKLHNGNATSKKTIEVK